MTKIKLYPNDTNISGDDKWIGSDGDSNEITKNFTVDDVGAYINALGVESVSTSDGSFIDLTPNTPTIGDVIVTADLSATGTPGATTFLRGDNSWSTPVDNNTTYDLGSSQQFLNVDINLTPSLGAVDTVSLIAGTNMQLVDDGSNNITINSTNTTYDLTSRQNGSNVDIDLTGYPLGDVDRVSLIAGTNVTLTHDGADNITINSTATAGIDGSGTANFIPKWQDTDTLTDSFVEVGASSLDVGANISIGFVDSGPLDSEIEFYLGGTQKLVIRSTAVNVANSNLTCTGYVEVGQSSDTANSNNTGAIRYRSDANNSYQEMSMQTGATTYAWVIIQQNTW